MEFYIGCKFIEVPCEAVPVADPVPESVPYQGDGWDAAGGPQVSGGAMPSGADPQPAGFVVPPVLLGMLGQMLQALLAKWLKK